MRKRLRHKRLNQEIKHFRSLNALTRKFLQDRPHTLEELFSFWDKNREAFLTPVYRGYKGYSFDGDVTEEMESSPYRDSAYRLLGYYSDRWCAWRTVRFDKAMTYLKRQIDAAK